VNAISLRMPRPIILTFIGRYLPGYKAGGALRTVANMAEALSDEFDFRIVTSDRDSGDDAPYPSIDCCQWHRVGKALVYYLPAEEFSVRGCARLIAATPHDTVYFQSFFSSFTIKPLMAMRLGLAGKTSRPVVAPRGEFYPGALAIRRTKKLCFLYAARLSGIHSRTLWQASSEEEAVAIRDWFGPAEIAVAPDLVATSSTSSEERTQKTSGTLRAFFLSRICPKKNLTGALRMLAGVKGEVMFDIFGPVEDTGYWQECRKAMTELPGNIHATYRGTIPHEAVPQTAAGYDLFLFPTAGENFGHVIMEALSAGCPVLISDQTPWRDLEAAKAGWDLPLEETDRFRSVLQTCVEMDETAHSLLRLGASRKGASYANDRSVTEANRELLRSAVRSRSL